MMPSPTLSAGAAAPLSWVEVEQCAGLAGAEPPPPPGAADSHSSCVQIVLSAQAPHSLVWASSAWKRLYFDGSGHETAAANRAGCNKALLTLLRGPMTDCGAIMQLLRAIDKAEPATVSLVSVTSSGRPYSHTLCLEPLKDFASGAVRCFQATSHDVEFLSPAVTPVHEPLAAPRAAEMALLTSSTSGSHTGRPPVRGLPLKGGPATTSNMTISTMMDWLA